MAANPKLEFYRFTLNHKTESFKTFKNFAKEELGGAKSLSDDKVTELCFKHFIKSLDGEFSKDDNLKKQLAIIKKKTVNKYVEKQPAFNSAANTIYGVINGGPYGRDRIVSDIDDHNDSTVLGRNKSVLLYFYVLLYVPTDHNEGCFIIHSNSADESITILFRNFITNIFKGKNYNKAVPEAFCPKSFQDEFKKGATLSSITFKNTFIETTHNTDPILHLLKQYDIKIEATPKDKNIPASGAEKVRKFFASKMFGSNKKERKLDDFNQTKIVVENQTGDAKKVFEWNTRDNEFVPVVYLKERLSKWNQDGTPDFDELGELCNNYFNDEVLIEIRPDKNAIKVK